MSEKKKHKNCGGELRMAMSLYIDVPFGSCGRITKRLLRCADVKLNNGKEIRVYCLKCGWSFLPEQAERISDV